LSKEMKIALIAALIAACATLIAALITVLTPVILSHTSSRGSPQSLPTQPATQSGSVSSPTAPSHATPAPTYYQLQPLYTGTYSDPAGEVLDHLVFYVDSEDQSNGQIMGKVEFHSVSNSNQYTTCQYTGKITTSGTYYLGDLSFACSFIGTSSGTDYFAGSIERDGSITGQVSGTPGVFDSSSSFWDVS
jgi:hypothetical protein